MELTERIKYLFWWDLETGGLDEFQHPILEHAHVITETTFPFNTVWAFTAVINPGSRWNGWRDRVIPFVREMHESSGLWDEIPHGRDIEEVQEDVTSVMEGLGEPGEFMSCGTGVSHLDRRMAKAQMPKLSEWFDHSNVDIGNVRRAFQFAGAESLVANNKTFTQGGPKHRALPDVWDVLAEYREYAAMFRNWVAVQALP